MQDWDSLPGIHRLKLILWEINMNRGTLTQKLAVADHLDDYILKHKRLKGSKPGRLFITPNQFTQLDKFSTPEANRKEWDGIPLEVRG